MSLLLAIAGAGSIAAALVLTRMFQVSERHRSLELAGAPTEGSVIVGRGFAGLLLGTGLGLCLAAFCSLFL
jgi:hypothetical protein